MDTLDSDFYVEVVIKVADCLFFVLVELLRDNVAAVCLFVCRQSCKVVCRTLHKNRFGDFRRPIGSPNPVWSGFWRNG